MEQIYCGSLPLPSTSCPLTHWQLPCLQTSHVLDSLQAVVVRETGAPRASRSNTTTPLLPVTPMSPIPGPPSGMLPHAHCLQRILSKIYLIDTLVLTLNPGSPLPSLNLFIMKLSLPHKMPPRTAKSKTSTRGFTPVNTMTHTATGSGSSCVQAEYAVKVRMLFGLGQVSLQVYSSSMYLSLNYIARMENSQIT